jgi:hypothetical protein
VPTSLDFAHCASGPETLEVPLTHADPFTALRYHFGMLLGVNDLEAQQAYHRGKTRLHNAWLHGAGVVWGMRVETDRAKREVRVKAGLALGYAGHELALDKDACVDVGAWLSRHEQTATAAGALVENPPGNFTLQVHVVAYMRACLTREVPALAEPCEGSNTDTAFSRVVETVRLELRAEAPVVPSTRGDFEHVRILLGRAAPRVDSQGTVIATHQEIAERRASLTAEPANQRRSAEAAALHRATVLDIETRMPGEEADGDRLLYPADEQTPIVLATIHNLRLTKNAGGDWSMLNDGVVDTSARLTLLSSGVLQQWLQAATRVPVDAGGPRLALQALAANTVTLVSDKPLSEPTVITGTPFSLSSRTAATGWQTPPVTAALAADKKTITLTLGGGVTLAVGDLVRVIARGQGPAPILGEDGVPLAGGVSGGPATVDDGRDFVAMQVRS